MNTYKIVKTTKKSVTVVFLLINKKTKTANELKQVLKTYRDITEGLSWLDENDFAPFIEATKNLLTGEELAKITKVYTPNKAQKQETTNQVQARKDWYNNSANIAKMNREIKKMQQDPGFMTGHDVTRGLIDSTINKDVQKLYGIK